MTRGPKTSADRLAARGLVAVVGGAGDASSARTVPRPPGHLCLRRAAEMVEGAAYELAGRESPVFISRLIEIAAELDRHARAKTAEGDRQPFGLD